MLCALIALRFHPSESSELEFWLGHSQVIKFSFSEPQFIFKEDNNKYFCKILERININVGHSWHRTCSINVAFTLSFLDKLGL